MNKHRIYLSGPMTGIKDCNRPLFNKVARQLRLRGYTVINPPELDHNNPPLTWAECLKIDLQYLLKCSDVATLPRWQYSRGANLEIYVATAVGLNIHEYKYYLQKEPNDD